MFRGTSYSIIAVSISSINLSTFPTFSIEFFLEMIFGFLDTGTIFYSIFEFIDRAFIFLETLEFSGSRYCFPREFLFSWSRHGYPVNFQVSRSSYNFENAFRFSRLTCSLRHVVCLDYNQFPQSTCGFRDDLNRLSGKSFRKHYLVNAISIR